VVWTPIEEVLWVLEPLRLQPPGSAPMRANEGRFQKQLQLAQYYNAQLRLYGRLAFQESYKCIAELRQQFSFDLLYAMLSNGLLPLSTRSHAAALVTSLYIAAYPYQCVTLPRYVRTFAALSKDVVLVRGGGNAATHALPSADAAVINDLFLLECFASSFLDGEMKTLARELERAGGQGEADADALLPFQAEVLALLRAMADRGFIASAEALRDSLCKPLITGVLDARSIALRGADNRRQGAADAAVPVAVGVGWRPTAGGAGGAQSHSGGDPGGDSTAVKRAIRRASLAEQGGDSIAVALSAEARYAEARALLSQRLSQRPSPRLFSNGSLTALCPGTPRRARPSRAPPCSARWRPATLCCSCWRCVWTTACPSCCTAGGSSCRTTSRRPKQAGPRRRAKSGAARGGGPRGRASPGPAGRSEGGSGGAAESCWATPR
jgi:hypothetical protein